MSFNHNETIDLLVKNMLGKQYTSSNYSTGQELSIFKQIYSSQIFENSIPENIITNKLKWSEHLEIDQNLSFVEYGNGQKILTGSSYENISYSSNLSDIELVQIINNFDITDNITGNNDGEILNNVKSFFSTSGYPLNGYKHNNNRHGLKIKSNFTVLPDFDSNIIDNQLYSTYGSPIEKIEHRFEYETNAIASVVALRYKRNRVYQFIINALPSGEENTSTYTNTDVYENMTISMKEEDLNTISTEWRNVTDEELDISSSPTLTPDYGAPPEPTGEFQDSTVEYKNYGHRRVFRYHDVNGYSYHPYAIFGNDLKNNPYVTPVYSSSPQASGWEGGGTDYGHIWVVNNPGGRLKIRFKRDNAYDETGRLDYTYPGLIYTSSSTTTLARPDGWSWDGGYHSRRDSSYAIQYREIILSHGDRFALTEHDYDNADYITPRRFNWTLQILPETTTIEMLPGQPDIGNAMFTITTESRRMVEFKIEYPTSDNAPGWIIKEDGVVFVVETENGSNTTEYYSLPDEIDMTTFENTRIPPEIALCSQINLYPAYGKNPPNKIYNSLEIHQKDIFNYYNEILVNDLLMVERRDVDPLVPSDLYTLKIDNSNNNIIYVDTSSMSVPVPTGSWEFLKMNGNKLQFHASNLIMISNNFNLMDNYFQPETTLTNTNFPLPSTGDSFKFYISGNLQHSYIAFILNNEYYNFNNQSFLRLDPPGNIQFNGKHLIQELDNRYNFFPEHSIFINDFNQLPQTGDTIRVYTRNTLRLTLDNIEVNNNIIEKVEVGANKSLFKFDGGELYFHAQNLLTLLYDIGYDYEFFPEYEVTNANYNTINENDSMEIGVNREIKSYIQYSITGSRDGWELQQNATSTTGAVATTYPAFDFGIRQNDGTVVPFPNYNNTHTWIGRGKSNYEDTIRKYNFSMKILKTDTYYIAFNTYNAYVDGYGGYASAVAVIDDKSYYFKKSVAGVTTSRTPGLNWNVGEIHEVTIYMYLHSYGAYSGSGFGMNWTTDTHPGNTSLNSSYYGIYDTILDDVTGWDERWDDNEFFEIGEGQPLQNGVKFNETGDILNSDSNPLLRLDSGNIQFNGKRLIEELGNRYNFFPKGEISKITDKVIGGVGDSISLEANGLLTIKDDSTDINNTNIFTLRKDDSLYIWGNEPNTVLSGGESIPGGPVLALENEIQSTEMKNWGWPTNKWNYYWSGSRDLALSGVFEQRDSGTADSNKIYWLVKNPLPNDITRVWITLIYSGSYENWSPGIGLNYRPYNGVGTPTGELHADDWTEGDWSPPSVDLLPGTEIAVGGGGGIRWGLRVYTYTPPVTQEEAWMELYGDVISNLPGFVPYTVSHETIIHNGTVPNLEFTNNAWLEENEIFYEYGSWTSGDSIIGTDYYSLKFNNGGWEFGMANFETTGFPGYTGSRIHSDGTATYNGIVDNNFSPEYYPASRGWFGYYVTSGTYWPGWEIGSSGGWTQNVGGLTGAEGGSNLIVNVYSNRILKPLSKVRIWWKPTQSGKYFRYRSGNSGSFTTVYGSANTWYYRDIPTGYNFGWDSGSGIGYYIYVVPYYNNGNTNDSTVRTEENILYPLNQHINIKLGDTAVFRWNTTATDGSNFLEYNGMALNDLRNMESNDGEDIKTDNNWYPVGNSFNVSLTPPQIKADDGRIGNIFTRSDSTFRLDPSGNIQFNVQQLIEGINGRYDMFSEYSIYTNDYNQLPQTGDTIRVYTRNTLRLTLDNIEVNNNIIEKVDASGNIPLLKFENEELYFNRKNLTELFDAVGYDNEFEYQEVEIFSENTFYIAPGILRIYKDGFFNKTLNYFTPDIPGWKFNANNEIVDSSLNPILNLSYEFNGKYLIEELGNRYDFFPSYEISSDNFNYSNGDTISIYAMLIKIDSITQSSPFSPTSLYPSSSPPFIYIWSKVGENKNVVLNTHTSGIPVNIFSVVGSGNTLRKFYNDKGTPVAYDNGWKVRDHETTYPQWRETWPGETFIGTDHYSLKFSNGGWSLQNTLHSVELSQAYVSNGNSYFTDTRKHSDGEEMYNGILTNDYTPQYYPANAGWYAEEITTNSAFSLDNLPSSVMELTSLINDCICIDNGDGNNIHIAKTLHKIRLYFWSNISTKFYYRSGTAGNFTEENVSSNWTYIDLPANYQFSLSGESDPTWKIYIVPYYDLLNLTDVPSIVSAKMGGALRGLGNPTSSNVYVHKMSTNPSQWIIWHYEGSEYRQPPGAWYSLGGPYIKMVLVEIEFVNNAYQIRAVEAREKYRENIYWYYWNNGNTRVYVYRAETVSQVSIEDRWNSGSSVPLVNSWSDDGYGVTDLNIKIGHDTIVINSSPFNDIYTHVISPYSTNNIAANMIIVDSFTWTDYTGDLYFIRSKYGEMALKWSISLSRIEYNGLELNNIIYDNMVSDDNTNPINTDNNWYPVGNSFSVSLTPPNYSTEYVNVHDNSNNSILRLDPNNSDNIQFNGKHLTEDMSYNKLNFSDLDNWYNYNEDHGMGIGGSENNQPMNISFSQPPSSLTNSIDPIGWYIENYIAIENLDKWYNIENVNGLKIYLTKQEDYLHLYLDNMSWEQYSLDNGYGGGNGGTVTFIDKSRFQITNYIATDNLMEYFNYDPDDLTLQITFAAGSNWFIQTDISTNNLDDWFDYDIDYGEGVGGTNWHINKRLTKDSITTENESWKNYTVNNGYGGGNGGTYNSIDKNGFQITNFINIENLDEWFDYDVDYGEGVGGVDWNITYEFISKNIKRLDPDTQEITRWFDLKEYFNATDSKLLIERYRSENNLILDVTMDDYLDINNNYLKPAIIKFDPPIPLYGLQFKNDKTLGGIQIFEPSSFLGETILFKNSGKTGAIYNEEGKTIVKFKNITNKFVNKIEINASTFPLNWNFILYGKKGEHYYYIKKFYKQRIDTLEIDIPGDLTDIIMDSYGILLKNINPTTPHPGGIYNFQWKIVSTSSGRGQTGGWNNGSFGKVRFYFPAGWTNWYNLSMYGNAGGSYANNINISNDPNYDPTVAPTKMNFQNHSNDGVELEYLKVNGDYYWWDGRTVDTGGLAIDLNANTWGYGIPGASSPEVTLQKMDFSPININEIKLHYNEESDIIDSLFDGKDDTQVAFYKDAEIKIEMENNVKLYYLKVNVPAGMSYDYNSISIQYSSNGTDYINIDSSVTDSGNRKTLDKPQIAKYWKLSYIHQSVTFTPNPVILNHIKLFGSELDEEKYTNTKSTIDLDNISNVNSLIKSAINDDIKIIDTTLKRDVVHSDFGISPIDLKLDKNNKLISNGNLLDLSNDNEYRKKMVFYEYELTGNKVLSGIQYTQNYIPVDMRHVYTFNGNDIPDNLINNLLVSDLQQKISYNDEFSFDLKNNVKIDKIELYGDDRLIENINIHSITKEENIIIGNIESPLKQNLNYKIGRYPIKDISNIVVTITGAKMGGGAMWVSPRDAGYHHQMSTNSSRWIIYNLSNHYVYVKMILVEIIWISDYLYIKPLEAGYHARSGRSEEVISETIEQLWNNHNNFALISSGSWSEHGYGITDIELNIKSPIIPISLNIKNSTENVFFREEELLSFTYFTTTKPNTYNLTINKYNGNIKNYDIENFNTPLAYASENIINNSTDIQINTKYSGYVNFSSTLNLEKVFYSEIHSEYRTQNIQDYHVKAISVRYAKLYSDISYNSIDGIKLILVDNTETIYGHPFPATGQYFSDWWYIDNRNEEYIQKLKISSGLSIFTGDIENNQNIMRNLYGMDNVEIITNKGRSIIFDTMKYADNWQNRPTFTYEFIVKILSSDTTTLDLSTKMALSMNGEYYNYYFPTDEELNINNSQPSVGDTMFTITTQRERIEKFKIIYDDPAYVPGWTIKENGIIVIDEIENGGIGHGYQKIGDTYYKLSEPIEVISKDHPAYPEGMYLNFLNEYWNNDGSIVSGENYPSEYATIYITNGDYAGSFVQALVWFVGPGSGGAPLDTGHLRTNYDPVWDVRGQCWNNTTHFQYVVAGPIIETEIPTNVTEYEYDLNKAGLEFVDVYGARSDTYATRVAQDTSIVLPPPITYPDLPVTFRKTDKIKAYIQYTITGGRDGWRLQQNATHTTGAVATTYPAFDFGIRQDDGTVVPFPPIIQDVFFTRMHRAKSITQDMITKYKFSMKILQTDTYYIAFNTYNNFVDGGGGYASAVAVIDDKSYYFKKSVSGGNTNFSNVTMSRTPGLNWNVGEIHEVTIYMYLHSYGYYNGSGFGFLWTTDTHGGDTDLYDSYIGIYSVILDDVTGWDNRWDDNEFFEIGINEGRNGPQAQPDTSEHTFECSSGKTLTGFSFDANVENIVTQGIIESEEDFSIEIPDTFELIQKDPLPDPSGNITHLLEIVDTSETTIDGNMKILWLVNNEPGNSSVEYIKSIDNIVTKRIIFNITTSMDLSRDFKLINNENTSTLLGVDTNNNLFSCNENESEIIYHTNDTDIIDFIYNETKLFLLKIGGQIEIISFLELIKDENNDYHIDGVSRQLLYNSERLQESIYNEISSGYPNWHLARTENFPNIDDNFDIYGNLSAYKIDLDINTDILVVIGNTSNNYLKKEEILVGGKDVIGEINKQTIVLKKNYNTFHKLYFKFKNTFDISLNQIRLIGEENLINEYFDIPIGIEDVSLTLDQNFGQSIRQNKSYKKLKDIIDNIYDYFHIDPNTAGGPFINTASSRKLKYIETDNGERDINNFTHIRKYQNIELEPVELTRKRNWRIKESDRIHINLENVITTNNNFKYILEMENIHGEKSEITMDHLYKPIINKSLVFINIEKLDEIQEISSLKFKELYLNDSDTFSSALDKKALSDPINNGKSDIYYNKNSKNLKITNGSGYTTIGFNAFISSFGKQPPELSIEVNENGFDFNINQILTTFTTASLSETSSGLETINGITYIGLPIINYIKVKIYDNNENEIKTETIFTKGEDELYGINEWKLLPWLSSRLSFSYYGLNPGVYIFEIWCENLSQDSNYNKTTFVTTIF